MWYNDSDRINELRVKLGEDKELRNLITKLKVCYLSLKPATDSDARLHDSVKNLKGDIIRFETLKEIFSIFSFCSYEYDTKDRLYREYGINQAGLETFGDFFKMQDKFFAVLNEIEDYMTMSKCKVLTREEIKQVNERLLNNLHKHNINPDDMPEYTVEHVNRIAHVMREQSDILSGKQVLKKSE